MNRIHTVGVFPLDEDGRVGAPTAQMLHTGRGPVSPNQDAAFPHSCWFDPSGQRLLCCDLAQDRVLVYDFDASTAVSSLPSGPTPRSAPAPGRAIWRFIRTGV